MQELQLSNDLNVITAEINSYKQVAGQAIFEIGKRLKHVKENDLVHGEFGKWLEEQVSFTDRQARRFMQIAEEFKTDDVVRIGTSKVFELLSIPQDGRKDFIGKQHEIPSTGKSKTVDEMTVRELREVKKQLKHTQEQLEQEQNKEPERIEVVPDDYDYIKGNFEAAQNMRDRYKEQLEEMRKELNETGKRDDSELERLKAKEIELKNRINTYEKLFVIQSSLESAISSISTQSHSIKVEEINGDYQTIDHFESTLDEVIKMCRQLKGKLPDKNIIEGEIIYD